MKLKEKIQQKAAKVFRKFSMDAVNYAEQLLGSETGAAKKEVAIDFLLSKLPIYLKPMVPFFRQILIKVADTIIEKAVGKMHQMQIAT